MASAPPETTITTTTTTTTQPSPRPPPTTAVPYKQIRARQPTPDTLVVYQAYSAAIALPAVREQRLDASDAFKVGRMTWVKPSFLWCMYRAGWSYKDPNQARILALTLRRDGFLELLRQAVGSMERDRPGGGGGGAGGSSGAGEEGEQEVPEQDPEAGGEEGGRGERKKGKPEVRFQWDPERSIRLGRLPYRSLQLGIAGSMVRRWLDEWIVHIEDVTEDVRRFHALLKTGGDEGMQAVAHELQTSARWREEVFMVGDELERALGMVGVQGDGAPEDRADGAAGGG